jgi:GTP-binding protein HflX
VGFISDLPTQLVAAFRATLEEVLEADLILHVRDIAHPDSSAQAEYVAGVLSELGVADRLREGAMEVWNKIDGLEGDHLTEVMARARTAEDGRAVPISALTGAGCPELVASIDRFFSAQRMILDLDIDLTDGRALAWLYARGEILERADHDQIAHVTVALDPPDLARFRKDFAVGAVS